MNLSEKQKRIQKQLEKEYLNEEIHRWERGLPSLAEEFSKERIDQMSSGLTVTGLDVICWIFGLIVIIFPLSVSTDPWLNNFAGLLFGVAIISTTAIRSTAHRIVGIVVIALYFLLTTLLPYYVPTLMPEVQFGQVLYFIFFFNVVGVGNALIGSSVGISIGIYGVANGLRKNRQHPGVAILAASLFLFLFDIIMLAVFTSPTLNPLDIFLLPAGEIWSIVLIAFTHLVTYLVALTITFVIFWIIGKVIRVGYKASLKKTEMIMK